MWFKNLRVYAFTQPFSLPENFNEQLEAQSFKACSRTEPASIGWITPVRDSEIFALEHADGVLLCLRKEEKVMPASAVKSELEARKESYEQEHARPMPRKEQTAIKEDIVHNLLPRALSRFSVTWGIIDVKNQRVIVDTSSATRAEEFNAQLRNCLGSLPVKPWGPEYPASHTLTQWVKTGETPTPFELGEEAELRSSKEEGMVVRFKRHELAVPEVTQHLEQGKHVVELGLNWDQRVQFVLSDDYGIKRLKFSELVLDQRDDQHTDSQAAQLDADFALMHAEFEALLEALMAAVTLPERN
ncbi:recombination-associated protein RdgC [Aliidiomarina celeris]|uniref:recombination-associated protein RdgC n=1 Tax=Aliidiomarina celeris TaxID=2249428 RepID=UPI000DEAE1D7|nr:recombination-associated protein RdgC [Aliidiomarina celeris]